MPGLNNSTSSQSFKGFGAKKGKGRARRDMEFLPFPFLRSVAEFLTTPRINFQGAIVIY